MDVQSRQKARAEEILAKKAKLAELKRNRTQRAQELQNSRLSSGERSDLAQPTPSRVDRNKDIESLLSSIEGISPRATSRSRPGSTISSRPLSGQRLSSENEADVLTPTSGPSAPTYLPSAATETFSFTPLIPVFEIPSAPEPEVVMYSKGVQTMDSWETEPLDGNAGHGDDGSRIGHESEAETRKEVELERIREQLKKEMQEELKSQLEPADVAGPDDEKPQRFPLRKATAEEWEAIGSSKDFKDLLDQSLKVMDRALDDQYDLLTDYSIRQDNLELDDDAYGKGRTRRGRRVKQVAQYWDPKWSNKRMISDIGFSPKYPELLLASFTKNPSSPNDPFGVIQVWNSHMPSHPEYIFHANSDITSAKFSPYHPSLILGGCYSGQVLLWDTRAKTPQPVQKTPLTGLGHSHPVYSLDIVGTQNANNIISASTDGTVCTWSVDMLGHPQERIELVAPSTARVDDVAPLCIAFPPNDPTYFLSGTEEGLIYSIHRYERAGAKAGIDSRATYAGHNAPVLGIDFHPARGPVDLADLLLSCSFDWSVKLWRVRPPATSSSTTTTTTATGTTTILPTTISTAGAGVTSSTTASTSLLMDFPREHAVYDVKWSPLRPGVFALVDESGALEVWDLVSDVEIPVARVTPTLHAAQAAAAGVPLTSTAPGAASAAGGSGTAGATEAPAPFWFQRSLNKVAWERSEGRKVAVGGLDGVISVFEVGNELGGTEGGRPEEWAAVKKMCNRIEAQAGARAVVNGK